MDKIRFGDKCLIVKEPATPIQGRDYCKSIGGDLASIESRGVQQFPSGLPPAVWSRRECMDR